MWGHVPPGRQGASNGQSIGEAVRRWRLARGWSQRDLARISRVHQSTISRFETGRLEGLSLRSIGRLAWALQAEEALLMALAPVGGEDVMGIPHDGLSPAAAEVVAIARKRPAGAADGASKHADHDPAPLGPLR